MCVEDNCVPSADLSPPAYRVLSVKVEREKKLK